jgi:Squalene/phytoene synthase
MYAVLAALRLGVRRILNPAEASIEFAGLVGVGLCHLFAASGCEDASFATDMDALANHMGLFLQKTNIIRDYLEDICELPVPRMFWPREIWGRYAGALAELKERENRCDAARAVAVWRWALHVVSCAARVEDVLKIPSSDSLWRSVH